MRNDDQPARQPRWLLHALGTLARVPSWLVVSAALTGAAVIAAFDIRGQHGAELRALYAIPAFVFTWRLGRPAGVAFAAVSLGTEVGVDLVLASHALENFTGYLPEFARFAAFLLVVEFAAETKNLVDREASDARADPLTSLLNRRGLREVGSRMCGIADRQRTPLAVLYADIDDFKTLNDRHGHATGDTALREFAAVLTTNLRQSDVAARVGGDEFVVLLPGTDRAGASAAADIIEEFLARRAQQTGLAMQASIGVVIGNPGDNIDMLLAAADAAMYEAKRDKPDTNGHHPTTTVSMRPPLDRSLVPIAAGLEPSPSSTERARLLRGSDNRTSFAGFRQDESAKVAGSVPRTHRGRAG